MVEIEKNENNNSIPPNSLPKSIIFSDPIIVASLFHEQKQQILAKLIQQEYTNYDLKTELNLNPGIIKRHIDDLLEKKLIIQTRVGTNSMGMTLKYYRAVAQKYIIHLEWSPK